MNYYPLRHRLCITTYLMFLQIEYLEVYLKSVSEQSPKTPKAISVICIILGIIWTCYNAGGFGNLIFTFSFQAASVILGHCVTNATSAMVRA